MKKMDDRTNANMEVALEQACRVLPYGGDHRTRKRIAHKLLHSARHGNTTLTEFLMVARAALKERHAQQRSAPKNGR
jgi:hypothetical protein